MLPWLEKWLGYNAVYQKVGGKTAEWRSGQPDLSSGAFWTRNSSEFRKGAAVCSLSEILETGPIAPRYYLSQKACAGILRRAAKRGKALPPALDAALRAVAGE